MERDELDKWSDALPSRRIVDDFLEWLSEQRMEVCEWTEDAKWPMPLAQSRDRLLNRYFDINEKKLEDQRRALLDEMGL